MRLRVANPLEEEEDWREEAVVQAGRGTGEEGRARRGGMHLPVHTQHSLPRAAPRQLAKANEGKNLSQ